MWKISPSIDRDKDAATLTAQLYDDTEKLIFSYSRRVSLYDATDIANFISEAKNKSSDEDSYNTKVAEYISQIEAQLNK
jgi:hypothetical protein